MLNTTCKNITGIILAGGKSLRMNGFPKGLLAFHEKTVIENIADALALHVQELMIISNTRHYDFLGIKTYSDIIKNGGPLGGIYTALTHSTTEKNFIVSCDMPFLTSDVVSYFLNNTAEHLTTLAEHDDVIEPLFSVYLKSSSALFHKLLKHKKLKLKDALHHLPVDVISIPTEIFGNTWHRNINTVNDYQLLLKPEYEFTY